MARHQERLPAATLGVHESYYYLQEPNKGKKNTTDWRRPKADTIKDRHLHCGLSQHLLSPKEMLAGAYLRHRVLLPQLFGLKKTCLTGDGRDERKENKSRTAPLRQVAWVSE